MCCGKGRDVIWLAQQGICMTGFDFSSNAINEARKRSAACQRDMNTNFFVQDATEPWALSDNTFDFVFDCFATTDIESRHGRERAVSSEN